jgi:uncharacterized protein (TIGR00661 family)
LRISYSLQTFLAYPYPYRLIPAANLGNFAPVTMKMKGSNRIMVCPLDWGLGHASRCIPVIRHLLDSGHELIIGASGRGAELLKEEFPKIHHFEFEGHSVSYAKDGFGTMKALMQAPAFMRSIENERYRIDELIEQYSPDLLISDGRLGVSSRKVKSVLINHQLSPKFPFIIQTIASRQLEKLHTEFDEIWVPDFEGENNLSGELSHPSPKRLKLRYIDPLSRFKNLDVANTGAYSKLAIISAPEPYRSRLENKILELFKSLPGEHGIICGRPESANIEKDKNVTIIPHSDASNTAALMKSSQHVISSAGYSSIMDLYTLGIEAELIPTPGQSEQEYLARSLHGRFGFKHFDKSLPEGEQISHRPSASPEKKIDEALKELLDK